MKCNTCETNFVCMENFEEYNQASGCAASLYNSDGHYFITGHYGSKYDMERYALKDDKYNVGNICDSCVTSLVESNKAYLIEHGVWF